MLLCAMPGDSVKVAVRVRPFNQREKNANSKCIISMSENSTILTNPHNGEQKIFAFDHSYWSHDGYIEEESGIYVPDAQNSNYADQQRVYNDLGQGVLDNAFEGYNAALFAYGQTGSGKSYSMVGYGNNKGIVPITCEKLFRSIQGENNKDKQYQVTFSMIEIYNEQVQDLLFNSKQPIKGGLKVRQHPKMGFYVEGLKQVAVQNYKEIEKWTDQGTLNRTTASTNMNATSSRSHMVITIRFKQIFMNDIGESTTKTSEINLVDLAGSERVDSSGATGDRLKEGSMINQSLSTLGNVISALADLSVGKKKVIVPYRDSVLTKLLQPALGGNSRTIMIAALSPADINYDETLSTLRYADRAKRIQNKAVINESPTEKLIRELKEENARLMAQLNLQDTHASSSSKTEELEHQLGENERQMKDLEHSWEQRLEEARREWERSYINSPEGEPEWITCPHLYNINEDPQLSGVIKSCFHHGVNIIGKPGEKSVTMELRGLGIQPKHAVINDTGSEVFIEPVSSRAKVSVNGSLIADKTALKHCDRIKLGSNNLYLYVGYPNERNGYDELDKYDYQYFQTELARSIGFGEKSLTQEDGIDSMSLMVFTDYISLLPKVYEANAISEELNKGVNFEPEIKNLATHDALGRTKEKEVIVRVTNQYTNKVWIWSATKFLNRKYLIDDMHQQTLKGEMVEMDKNKDPFWDPEEDIFLGSCHVWLHSLAYCIESDDHLEVCNYQGSEVATMHVKVVPCDIKGNLVKDELIVLDPTELIGRRLDFMVMIPQCTSVKWTMEENSRGVYTGFNFFEHPKMIKGKTIWNSINPKMKFKKQFTIHGVTEDFLEYLQTQALVIELWGTQAGNKKTNLVSPRKQLGYDEEIQNELAQKMKDMQARIVQQQEDLHKIQKENAKLEKENTYMKDKITSLKSSSENPDDCIQSHSPRNSIPPMVSYATSSRRMSLTLPAASPTMFMRRSSMTIRENENPSPVPSDSSTASLDEKSSLVIPQPRPPEVDRAPISLDGEIAKALKIFLRDIKGVQKKLAESSELGSPLDETSRGIVLYSTMKKQQACICDIEQSLNFYIKELKSSMIKVIRMRNKAENLSNV